MTWIAGAAAVSWGVLVFANYLSVHGFLGEFTVPAVFLGQWRDAWPGASPAYAAFLGHARAGLCAAAVLLAGTGAGAALFRWVGGRRPGPLDRLALGAGIAALWVFGLGLSGLAFPGVFAALAGAGLAWSAIPLSGLVRIRPATRITGIAALAVTGAILLLDLAAALWPEWSYDALLYHLAVPARILADHRFTLLEGHMQFSFPLNPEMLYAAAMALGGETAGRLVNLGLWIASLGAVARLARAAGGSPVAGPLAAAIFLAQPVLGVETESAFAESGWTLWIALAAAHAVGDRPRTGIAAAYVGLASGAKYIAVLQAIPLAFLLLPASRRRGLPSAAALGCAVAAPWYAKNWLFQSDPFFPALAHWGVSFGFSEEKLSLKQLEVADYGLPVFSRPWLFFLLPWDYTQHDLGGRYWQETSGPLLLAAAPLVAAAILRHASPAARRLAFLGAAWALIWAASNQWDRLLVPALAPAAALAAWALADMGPARLRRAAVFVALVTIAWSALLRMDRRIAVERYYRLNEAATGKLSRAQWSADVLPLGPLLPKLGSSLPPRSKVLVVWEQLGYGLPVRYVWESVQSRALLARLAAESWSVRGIERRLRQQGITHLVVSAAGRAKAAAWGQYGGLGTRAADRLESFISALPPPAASAGPLALYLLPR